jgi:hypothetical protein
VGFKEFEKAVDTFCEGFYKGAAAHQTPTAKLIFEHKKEIRGEVLKYFFNHPEVVELMSKEAKNATQAEVTEVLKVSLDIAEKIKNQPWFKPGA